MSTDGARFHEQRPDGSIRCVLCHHRCVIAPGSSGVCRVRRNSGGTMELPFFGRASVLSVDPIEKKPLYHFLPGSQTWSIGYVGCNMRCPFCQNHEISQSTSAMTERITPELLVSGARHARCPSIAHTYSEPLVHAEFVIECMKYARAAGLLNILVTNGCALEPASTEILTLCDAVNVDIKAFDAAWYRDELGGDLDTVLAFISEAFRLGVHIEATTLVIPGKNDDNDQIHGIASFLADLSPDIPLHLSAYRPMYRYSVPPTPKATIDRAVSTARRQLNYVYPGNVTGERSITVCQECGATLLSRLGYATDTRGLRGSRCAVCGSQSPIINSL
jgi:pyruvate formate lyase activating enzyme